MCSLSVLRRPVRPVRGTGLTGGVGRLCRPVRPDGGTGPTGREGSELVIVRIDVGPFDLRTSDHLL